MVIVEEEAERFSSIAQEGEGQDKDEQGQSEESPHRGVGGDCLGLIGSGVKVPNIGLVGVVKIHHRGLRVNNDGLHGNLETQRHDQPSSDQKHIGGTEESSNSSQP